MRLIAMIAALAAFTAPALAQDYSNYSEDALRAELARIATAETKVLVPMRDGIGLSTDIYRPRDADEDVPVIFWRTRTISTPCPAAACAWRSRRSIAAMPS